MALRALTLPVASTAEATSAPFCTELPDVLGSPEGKKLVFGPSSCSSICQVWRAPLGRCWDLVDPLPLQHLTADTIQ